MESGSSTAWLAAGIVIMASFFARDVHGQQLQLGFYGNSCPDVQDIVFDGMRQAVQSDRRVAASMLRLFFHDCLVQGCDASVLLDDTAGVKGEKNADPNRNSLRGFEVVDDIKASLEDACPGVVSCADIIALAARDAVVLSGGPGWDVALGRRDSRTVSFQQANSVLPSPFSTLDELVAGLQRFGFSLQDLVTLSGAHTFGQARCLFVRDRIYNMTGDGTSDITMNGKYVRLLQARCPDQSDGGADDNLLVLDPFSPTVFDNRYYLNLMNGWGFFSSDQALFSTPRSASMMVVHAYAQNQRLFFSNFASVMIRLGNLNPLTGNQGDIRRNCHIINT